MISLASNFTQTILKVMEHGGEDSSPFLHTNDSRSPMHVSFLSILANPHAQGIILCLVVVSTFSLVTLYNSIRPVHVPHSVPGPKRHPFFGILLHAIQHWEKWPEECHRLSTSYDHRTWGGPAPSLKAFFFTNDAMNVKYILHTNFDNYVKGDQWRDLFSELLGNGIFTSDGDVWKRHRKIISCMFSRNLLRHSALVTKEKLKQVEEFLDRKLFLAHQGEMSADGINVDIQDIFYRMTIDSTSAIAFGIELHSFDSDRQHDFALAFDELGKLSMERFLDPLFRLKRALHLSKRERRIRVLSRQLDQYAMGVVRSKRRASDEGHPLGPDLLSRFIDHANKYNDGGSNDEQNAISDRELRDAAMNIILAGRDTTACALSWTWYELTRHPKVVENIIVEVNRVCGKGPDADLTFDSVSRLDYTHATVIEALRLHPPVANDFRYAVEDDQLPDGTSIPKGAGVCLLPYSMGRNKNIWGEDAMEFKPERFLGTEPSSYKYLTFYAGPRLCLGKPLALMNIKLTLAYLLPRFEFTDRNGHNGAFAWTLVQSMKDGFNVHVNRRKDLNVESATLESRT